MVLLSYTLRHGSQIFGVDPAVVVVQGMALLIVIDDGGDVG
jgi:hypothetical protein